MSKPAYLLDSFELECNESGDNDTKMKSNAAGKSKQLSSSSSSDNETEIVSDVLPKDEEGNSMLMTGFLMLNAMIGSGILNQPSVFAQAGIGSAILMFTVAAIFMWLSLIVLIECGIKVGKFDYSSLAKYVFGDSGEAIVDISIVLGNFGALLSYLDIIGGTSSDLFSSWGCQSAGCDPTTMTTIFSVCFILPVCSMRYFGHLAGYSVFSMAAIMSCLILVIIAGPIVGSDTSPGGFKRGSGVQLGSIVFTLNCSFAAFHSYKSMKDPDPKKWRVITASIVFVGYFMCVAMGVAGYLSFGNDVDGMILNSFTGHYADFFKILLVVHLILYIPVEFMVMRHSLIKLMGTKSGTYANFQLHLAITSGLLFLAALIILLLRAAGFSQGNAFSLVLDFTGAITGSIISFILPGAFYLKLYQKNEEFFYGCAVMLVFGIIIMIVVPILSVLYIVD